MDDRDIRGAFEELKRHDEEHSPRFKLPNADRPPRWRWRSGVITAAAIGMTATTLLILSTLNSTAPPDPAPSAPIATNPFDRIAGTPTLRYDRHRVRIHGVRFVGW